jgi:hypothetical protein
MKLATAFSISPQQEDVRGAALQGLQARSRGATDAAAIGPSPPGVGQQAPPQPGTNEVAQMLTVLFQRLQEGNEEDWQNFLQFLAVVQQELLPLMQGAGGQGAPQGAGVPTAQGPVPAAPTGGPIPPGPPPGPGGVPTV